MFLRDPNAHMKTDLDETIANDEEREFVAKWLHAFKSMPEMRDTFVNHGDKEVVNLAQNLYKLYKDYGIEDVNAWSIKAELQHFSGAKMDESAETAAVVDDLVSYIKGVFNKKPLGKKK